MVYLCIPLVTTNRQVFFAQVRHNFAAILHGGRCLRQLVEQNRKHHHHWRDLTRSSAAGIECWHWKLNHSIRHSKLNMQNWQFCSAMFSYLTPFEKDLYCLGLRCTLWYVSSIICMRWTYLGEETIQKCNKTVVLFFEAQYR